MTPTHLRQFGGGYPHPSTWPVNAMTLSVPFVEESVFVPGYGGKFEASVRQNRPLMPQRPLPTSFCLSGSTHPPPRASLSRLTCRPSYSTVPHMVPNNSSHGSKSTSVGSTARRMTGGRFSAPPETRMASMVCSVLSSTGAMRCWSKSLVSCPPLGSLGCARPQLRVPSPKEQPNTSIA